MTEPVGFYFVELLATDVVLVLAVLTADASVDRSNRCPFLMISMTECRFILLIGRQGTIRTTSPISHFSSSSCAMNFRVRFTCLSYLGKYFSRSTLMVTLLLHLSDTTMPIIDCRRFFRSSYCFSMSEISF